MCAGLAVPIAIVTPFWSVHAGATSAVVVECFAAMLLMTGSPRMLRYICLSPPTAPHAWSWMPFSWQ